MRCILITYFKYLHFNYLTIPQINMQNNGSSSLAKYTKLCMVWQLNIRNMLWDFGFAHGPHWGTSVRRPHVPLAPNPGYATAYVHLSHGRNFTLKSGGDQWRRQDLVSWGTTIEAPKAPSWWGVRSPADYRRSGGASWASPARSGRGWAPTAIAFSAYFRPHAERFWWQEKYDSLATCPKYKEKLVFLYENMHPACSSCYV